MAVTDISSNSTPSLDFQNAQAESQTAEKSVQEHVVEQAAKGAVPIGQEQIQTFVTDKQMACLLRKLPEGAKIRIENQEFSSKGATINKVIAHWSYSDANGDNAMSGTSTVSYVQKERVSGSQDGSIDFDPDEINDAGAAIGSLGLSSSVTGTVSSAFCSTIPGATTCGVGSTSGAVPIVQACEWD